MALGAAIAVLVGAVGAGVVEGLRGGELGAEASARAEVADGLTAAVGSGLEPLGFGAGPDLLAAPAAFVDALAAADDDAGVLRAAAAAEGLLALLEPAEAAIDAIDVPAAVRGKGLDEPFVIDLIQSRQRILDALALYRAAAELAAEAAFVEQPSLSALLATARDIAARAEAAFLEGHDLLVEAQVAAGTYGGPLVPGSGGLG